MLCLLLSLIIGEKSKHVYSQHSLSSPQLELKSIVLAEKKKCFTLPKTEDIDFHLSLKSRREFQDFWLLVGSFICFLHT